MERDKVKEKTERGRNDVIVVAGIGPSKNILKRQNPGHPLRNAAFEATLEVMRTVVIGVYGNFGARICRALSADPDIWLPVAALDGWFGNRRTAEYLGMVVARRARPGIASSGRGIHYSSSG